VNLNSFALTLIILSGIVSGSLFSDVVINGEITETKDLASETIETLSRASNLAFDDLGKAKTESLDLLANSWESSINSSKNFLGLVYRGLVDPIKDLNFVLAQSSRLALNDLFNTKIRSFAFVESIWESSIIPSSNFFASARLNLANILEELGETLILNFKEFSFFVKNNFLISKNTGGVVTTVPRVVKPISDKNLIAARVILNVGHGAKYRNDMTRHCQHVLARTHYK
jgi:hypothetical protein